MRVVIDGFQHRRHGQAMRLRIPQAGGQCRIFKPGANLDYQAFSRSRLPPAAPRVAVVDTNWRSSAASISSTSD